MFGEGRKEERLDEAEDSRRRSLSPTWKLLRLSRFAEVAPLRAVRPSTRAEAAAPTPLLLQEVLPWLFEVTDRSPAPRPWDECGRVVASAWPVSAVGGARSIRVKQDDADSGLAPTGAPLLMFVLLSLLESGFPIMGELRRAVFSFRPAASPVEERAVAEGVPHGVGDALVLAAAVLARVVLTANLFCFSRKLRKNVIVACPYGVQDNSATFGNKTITDFPEAKRR